jgi:TolB-like protein
MEWMLSRRLGTDLLLVTPPRSSALSKSNSTTFLCAIALAGSVAAQQPSGYPKALISAEKPRTPAQPKTARALDGLYTQLLAVDLGSDRPAVAILPFTTTGTAKVGYDAGTMAAEYGAVRLAKDYRVQLVDRSNVNALLKEQALTLSGVATDSGAVQAGKILSVRYLITGSVLVEGRTQTVSARLTSVETGAVVSAALATVESEQAEDLYRSAIGERDQLSSSLYRSAVGPGWGQFYTGHPVHGALALTAVVGALGWLGWNAVDFRDKEDRLSQFRDKDASTVIQGEIASAWTARAEAARADRNAASRQVTISLLTLGGVWIVNLVDAGILGYRDSRGIRSEYFSLVPAPVATGDGLALSWRF